MRVLKPKTVGKGLLLVGAAAVLTLVIRSHYKVFSIPNERSDAASILQKVWSISPFQAYNFTDRNTTLPANRSAPNATFHSINEDSMPKPDSEAAILEQIRSYTNTLPNTTEVSVVTAYFNLGPLDKRSSEGRYNPDLYKRWMSTFRWLDNPLVVFVDTEDTAAHFRQLRAHYPPSRTTVILLRRDELWAFRLEPEIRKIYAQKGYPRHPPNTINPGYSCAMHAKFELMQKVLLERLHQTRYVAWLDIGLFRDEVRKNKTIHLTVPRDFKRTHVGYSEVNRFVRMTPADVIRRNMVWVGGASFLATPEVMYMYCSDYRRAVRKLLDMKWMSTDQQVIYIMFQPSFNFTRRFQLQNYTRHPANKWFSIGYLMKLAP